MCTTLQAAVLPFQATPSSTLSIMSGPPTAATCLRAILMAWASTRATISRTFRVLLHQALRFASLPLARVKFRHVCPTLAVIACRIAWWTRVLGAPPITPSFRYSLVTVTSSVQHRPRPLRALYQVPPETRFEPHIGLFRASDWGYGG